MIETTGSCSGIENYSRYLSGRKPGEPPPTLYEYIPEDSLLFIDESHITCSVKYQECIKVIFQENQPYHNMDLDYQVVLIIDLLKEKNGML